MIEGLEGVFDNGRAGVPELCRFIEQMIGGSGAPARLIGQQLLKPRTRRVVRLRFLTNGGIRSLVVKRLMPEVARRTELVDRRWLPAVGLGGSGPALLGSLAEPGGGCVWHVYDDLGDHGLNAEQLDRARVRTAIDLISSVHARFGGHPVLGEVRLHGGDLGIQFYESNVKDAAYALAACRGNTEDERLRGRLLRLLERLLEELPQRAGHVHDYGGPETVLHGDLWAVNVFVLPAAGCWHARLIDWDHVAVGPASYDLSTFLLRFPCEQRAWLLQQYRDSMARGAGWSLPDDRQLNVLFETAEYARFANRLIWPAIAVAQDHARWGWDVLSEVEGWFDAFRTVLAVSDGTMPAARVTSV